jgi:hypothetical protein
LLELVNHPLLSSNQLAINREYKLFMCTDCHQALRSGLVRPHLNDLKKLRISSNTIEKIIEVGASYGVVDEYPSIDRTCGPIDAVAGLTIFFKHGCPYCPYTAGEKTVRSHIRDDHPNLFVRTIADIPCQYFHAGEARSYFRVILPPRVVSPLTLEESLIREFEEYNPYRDNISSPPDDYRFVSPWIARTGFHLLAKGKEVSQCRALVASPVENEASLQGLGEAVMRLMDDSSRLIDVTDSFTLQRLNSYDADTE